MKIIAFGDSWVWGDELGDFEFRNKKNITGLIRNHYKIETLNFSVNGSSLDEIIFQLMIYFESDLYDKDNLILIGLTSPIRQYHYNNIVKEGIRFPNWYYESFKKWGNAKLVNDVDYETWWKLNLKFNINGNNDIINYTKSLLSIKSLLDNYSTKHIIWQSIDGGMYDFIENDFSTINFHYTTEFENKFNQECKIFNKNYLDKILKNNTTNNQIWLNISEISWEDWLKTYHSDKKVFFKMNFHPTELGIELWFNGFLKKYIDKILNKNDNNNRNSN